MDASGWMSGRHVGKNPTLRIEHNINPITHTHTGRWPLTKYDADGQYWLEVRHPRKLLWMYSRARRFLIL